MGFHAFNSIISGGRSNMIDFSVDTATIGGGGDNYIGSLAHYTTIGAGKHNLIFSNAAYAVVSGGQDNTIWPPSDHSVIGGGEDNQAKSSHDTIGGGSANSISADTGTIAGGSGNSIETNAYESVISGGSGNIIHTNAVRSTIAGGVFHEIFKDASYSAVGGGTRNMAKSNAYHATISGGSNNSIDHDTSYCSIGGGKLHTVVANSAHATIAGGDGNIAAGEAPAIGGGTLNEIDSGSTYSTIAGGGGNFIGANSFGSTIAGGYLNQASGNFCLAAGNRAQANHPGTFAWAGGNTMAYASIFPYCFNIYASNGVSMDYSTQTAGSPCGTRFVYVGSINVGNTISTWTGARLTDAGIWSNASDKNRKTDFKEIDARAVLDRLAVLPVRQWRYTNEATSIKHVGPVAQDFQAAFGLGDDDKTIGTIDADGVALAAIQGLNQKLGDRSRQADLRVERLEAENAELRHELIELKALIKTLALKPRQ
jgi:trimeric autotransporter adhesin